MKIDKILDLFMFHEGTDEDSDTQNPKVTTGSIVWGVILRTILMVLLIFFVRERFDFGEYWYMLIFTFWFLVAYPAHRQYQKFTERMETFVEETLCGQCKHFNSTAFIGNETTAYISNMLSISIFIYKLYKNAIEAIEIPDPSDRPIVIIAGNGGHYEVIGLNHPGQGIQTVFFEQNEFIKFLRSLYNK